MTTLVLFFAAFIGGALNSLAGGGTLVTFPALLFAGLNPIDANATSIVALFPGAFTAAWAYQRSILAITEFSVGSGLVLSLIGGLVGALLLLHTPATLFADLVPSLILFATVVFAVGNLAPLQVIQRVRIGPRGALIGLFTIAIYGGYFGGGHYRGEEVKAALQKLRKEKGDPYEGIKLDFVNPVTGKPVFKTMNYSAQLLRPGDETEWKRETAGTYYVCIEGSGTTEVGGKRLEWGHNDLFVVPNFLRRRHINTGMEDAIIYSVSDAALMRNIGQYYAQGRDQHGKVADLTLQ
jgi:hypothetical protein